MSAQTKTVGTESNEVAVGGTVDWQRLNDFYPYAATASSTGTKDVSVFLIKNNSISGNNKATEQSLQSADITYGGGGDLWGLSLTQSDINSSGFGFALVASGVSTGGASSNFLVVKNFGFTIPDNSVINGIELNITTSTNDYNVFVLSYSLTVYYSISTPIVGNKYAIPPFKNVMV